MKKLLIVGAGGCGREVYQWVVHAQYVSHVWDAIEFLDDNPGALDRYNLSCRISGRVSNHLPDENEYFICAIGDSRTRMDICRYLSKQGARFTNAVHPTVITADSCILGKGVILCPRVIISTDVKIGDFVLVNSSSFAGHDSVLESGCTLSAQCNVMGFARLEEGAFLGGGAQILPGVKVGRYARVGAGAVVAREVTENSTVLGNPAKKIFL